MNSRRIGLAELSELNAPAFSARLGNVFEHSAWIADHAWAARPFASIDELHAAMVRVVHEAGPDAVMALLRLHPELGSNGRLTAASAAEQGSAGLPGLDRSASDALAAANLRYRERFGFPFIIAVRGQRDASAILDAMHRRLENTTEAEIETAFAEVARIARFRLDDIVEPRESPLLPTPAGGPGGVAAEPARDSLTVHVLDQARGRPAAGLGLTLSRDGQVLSSHVTNADGRCDRPLLAGEAMRPGSYAIDFDVESWRAGDPEPGFYDRITIRFRITGTPGHIHVPLLLSPFGYSTYRGS